MSATLYARGMGKALCLLHRAQATGANRKRFRIATDGNLNLADIGLPTSLGLAVRVRNVLTKHDTFAANTTFCHP